MAYDLAFIEKNKKFYANLLRRVAKNVKSQGLEIKDNFFLREGMRDTRIYMFTLKRQIFDDWYIWHNSVYDKIEQIKEWANQGDRDAQLYLEICEIFEQT